MAFTAPLPIHRPLNLVTYEKVCSLRILGQKNDGTGLYYYRARYYRPDLQWFVAEEPNRVRRS